MKVNSLFLSCILLLMPLLLNSQQSNDNEDRQFYVAVMLKIAHPVLSALSKNELKKTMPVEVSSKAINDRSKHTYLEAFGRTLSGISPWLELGKEN